MKLIQKILMVSFITAFFACHNQQSKKPEADSKTVENMPSGDSVIKKSDNTGQLDEKQCEELITEILTTSPRYKQLTKGRLEAVIKNGGLSFGLSLEKKQNPEQDSTKSYSFTYEFTLYETYPDRRLNSTRFSFDPNNKQLYEYDPVLGQLEPIEFDRNLLLKWELLFK